jgi:ATP-dependent Clp protease protease subunit
MNGMPESRYVLPSFEERTSYGQRTLDPYSKLFSDRVIFLGTAVDDVSANDIMSQLLVMESMDSDADIMMYINSPGGSITAMTAIIDTMNYVAPHVATVCLGQAASAAAVILAAGQPGKRAALPNSRVMIHQPATGGGPGQASDIELQAAEVLRMRTWLEESLAGYTGQPVERIQKDVERDKFLTAQQAVEYGLIDVITPSRKRRS